LSDEIEVTGNTKVDALKVWQQPRLLSIIFCDSYKVADDAKTDLMGIFDRIYVHPESRHTPQFILFVRTAETTDGALEIICYAPDGKIPTRVSYDPVPESSYTANLPANFQGITTMLPFYIYTEGVYWFNVSFNGQSLGGAALVIELRETEDKKGGTDTYI
jgi:hypothetical protein